MAVSRVRAVSVPWGSQPQEWTPIDEMSPLNEDLVLSVRGGRGFLDEVQGGYPTIAAGVSISPGAFGPEFTFSGSQADNSFTFGASTLLSGATAATWDLLAYFNAANPTAQIFSQWDGGNQNWLLQASAGKLIWVACDDSGGGRTRFDLSGAFPAAGYYRITAAWRGGASFKLLINGVDRSSSVTTVSSAGSVMSGGFDGLKLGMATSQTALNGRIAYARIWKRGLGDPALSSLLAGNWEIYAPQQILVPVSSVTFSHSATGGLTFAGEATTAYTTDFVVSASGGIVFAGAATATFTRDFAQAGAGGLTFGGAATTLLDVGFTFAASGGLTFSGAATTDFTRNFAQSGAGGLVLGGLATASNTADFAQAGAGGLTFSGAAGTLLEVGYTHTASGGLQLAGAAGVAYTFDYAHSASGGLILAGAASSSFTANFSQVASGGLLFSGVATTSYTSSDYAYSGTGGLTFGGAALTIGPPVPVTLDLSGGGGARRGPHADEAANRRIKAMRDQEIHARNQQIIQAIVAMVTSGALDDMTVE